jgi:hypothetical protein
MPRKAKAAAPAPVLAPAVSIADQCGWSPDGLIGEHGAVEVKCPRPANHWTAWRDATGKTGLAAVPSQYRAQLLHAFVVGEGSLDWIDWVSYCPQFPASLQLLVIRVKRVDCETEIGLYLMALSRFLEELEEELGAMREHCVTVLETDKKETDDAAKS